MGVQGLLRTIWCRIVGVEERDVGGFESRHMVAYLAVQLRETRARAERAERERDAALGVAERAEWDLGMAFGVLRDLLAELHTDPRLGPALHERGLLGKCWGRLEAAERRYSVRAGEGGGDAGNGDGIEVSPW